MALGAVRNGRLKGTDKPNKIKLLDLTNGQSRLEPSTSTSSDLHSSQGRLRSGTAAGMHSAAGILSPVIALAAHHHLQSHSTSRSLTLCRLLSVSRNCLIGSTCEEGTLARPWTALLLSDPTLFSQSGSHPIRDDYKRWFCYMLLVSI
jgi:hypothetical protein